MPVIKQQTQIFSQPIGVVRASGSTGLANQISGFADQMLERRYRVAAEDAQRAGEKAGLAVATDKVVEIDPMTGNPVAYTPPQDFGRIASNAYQQMIDRRFEDSVKTELLEKGKEFASTSSSAAQYRDRFSAYVADMHSAATVDGEQTAYGRIIQDMGEAYVADTYGAMAKAEAEAARAALLRDRERQFFLGLNSTVNLAGTGQAFEDAISVLESDLEAQWNSGSMSPSAYASAYTKIEGLKALDGSTDLAVIASSMGAGPELNQLTAAIANPDNISPALLAKYPNIRETIYRARSASSPSALVSGINLAASSADQVSVDNVNLAAAGVNLAPDAGYADIYRAASTAAAEAGLNAEESTRLLGITASSWMQGKLGEAAASNPETMRQLEAAVRGIDRGILNSIFGEEEGAQIAGVLSKMTPDARKSISTEFGELGGIYRGVESDQQSSTRVSFEAEARGLADHINPITAYTDLTTRIKAQSEVLGEGVDPLLTKAKDGLMAGLQRIIREGAGYITSPERLQAIASEVQSPTGSFKPRSESEAGLYTLLSEAYAAERTTTTGLMADLIKGRKDAIDAQVAEDNFMVQDAMALSGIVMSDNDLASWEQSVTGGRTYTLEQYVTGGAGTPQGDIYAAAIGGNVTNNFKQTLLRSMASEDRQQVELGYSVFESLSQLEGDSRFVDRMRLELSPQEYAKAMSVVHVARERGLSPFDVRNTFLSYGTIEDINRDLKLATDMAASSSVEVGVAKYFADKGGIHPHFANEVAAVLRYEQAMGAVLDEDSIQQVADRYADMFRKDDMLIGAPRIGEQVMYSPKLYFHDSLTSTRGNQMVDQLNAALEPYREDPLYADYLNEYFSPEDFAVSLGFDALPDYVKLKPVSQSFPMNPTWEVFVEGVDGSSPVIIDGQAITISAPMPDISTFDQDTMRFSAHTAWSRIKYSDLPVEIRAQSYLMTLITRPHIDSFEILERSAPRAITALGRDAALEFFETNRAEYEALN